MSVGRGSRSLVMSLLIQGSGNLLISSIPAAKIAAEGV